MLHAWLHSNGKAVFWVFLGLRFSRAITLMKVKTESLISFYVLLLARPGPQSSKYRRNPDSDGPQDYHLRGQPPACRRTDADTSNTTVTRGGLRLRTRFAGYRGT